MNKVWMLALAAGLAGCMDSEVRTVDADSEALAVRCKATLIAESDGLWVVSSDRQDIVIRPSNFYGTTTLDPFQTGQLLGRSVAQAAAARTGERVMENPFALIADGLRRVQEDGRVSVCRYDWESLTNETTGEVFVR